MILLIPGAAIGHVQGDWPVSLFFALSFPLLWRAGQLWPIFCDCAANLLQADSAPALPKIERHARLACISIFLTITTLAALLIALRFGSFWWAFWGIGTCLLLFVRSLGKISKFLLLQLPLILASLSLAHWLWR